MFRQTKRVIRQIRHSSVSSNSAVQQQSIDSSIHPNLSPKYQNILIRNGIKELFPIQKQTFDIIMDGKDLIARAKTGSGKSLAFLLPIGQILQNSASVNKRDFAPRSMILCPTRELATQVHDVAAKFLPDLKSACIYGGVGYGPQVNALRSADICIGTPGRIVDLLDSNKFNLSQVQLLCLDESDYMLDIGFEEQLEQILGLIKKHKASTSNATEHQTLLFSATMPTWVKQAARKFFRPGYTTIDLVGQENNAPSSIKYLAIPCKKDRQLSSLIDILALHYTGTWQHTRPEDAALNGGGQSANKDQILIFTQTKKEANEVATKLHQAASSFFAHKLNVAALHSDLGQRERDETLQQYRDGKLNVLVCTDVASRGLDIKNVNMVVQMGPPDNVESFVHRSGRTGRANNFGTNVTLFDPSQSNDRRKSVRYGRGGGSGSGSRDFNKLIEIEKDTKIVMDYVSVPTKQEVMSASLETTIIPQVMANLQDDLAGYMDHTRTLLTACGMQELQDQKSSALVAAMIKSLTNDLLTTNHDGDQDDMSQFQAIKEQSSQYNQQLQRGGRSGKDYNNNSYYGGQKKGGFSKSYGSPKHSNSGSKQKYRAKDYSY
ncbi:hypothetical protein MIR68_008432 [Amoeboaphelidium protococcarum]|nr:hypothetical protein MIR68_008432 [Amoeboaphelidium protococcarum]